MPTDPEVNVAVAEFKRLVPQCFGDERDYDVIRKVLIAAERERVAANQMHAASIQSGPYDWRRDPTKNAGNGY